MLLNGFLLGLSGWPWSGVDDSPPRGGVLLPEGVDGLDIESESDERDAASPGRESMCVLLRSIRMRSDSISNCLTSSPRAVVSEERSEEERGAERGVRTAKSGARSREGN